MNGRRILQINLLNRRQRFDSDARRLMLKDTDQCHPDDSGLCLAKGIIHDFHNYEKYFIKFNS